jgi:hypothetical protein
MNVKSLINALWDYDPEDTVSVCDLGIVIHEVNFDLDNVVLLDKFDGDIDNERNYY